MQLLTEHGIERIFHFAPLHYLPFLARSQCLKSKPVLATEGFLPSHFRSTSAHIDDARGFGNYVHLSTIPTPPILAAKLESGFPHFGIELRTADYPQTPYDLCRFNIAKTRYLRRDGKPGFSESAANGRYYGALQIPIARSDEEKTLMLDARIGDPMVEVLVDQELPLFETASLRTYCDVDQNIAENILHHLGVVWGVELHIAPSTYVRKSTYAHEVDEFVQAALGDPDWRGNGLEFDRV